MAQQPEGLLQAPQCLPPGPTEAARPSLAPAGAQFQFCPPCTMPPLTHSVNLGRWSLSQTSCVEHFPERSAAVSCALAQASSRLGPSAEARRV